MTGICVENCNLLLLKSSDEREANVYFNMGDIVEIGEETVSVEGDDYVVLNKHLPAIDYLIKKADRDKFFKKRAEEVVQCESFEAMSRSRGYESASCFVNEFLRKIRPESIVSCGYDDGRFWVYYKTFVEKGWEE